MCTAQAFDGFELAFARPKISRPGSACRPLLRRTEIQGPLACASGTTEARCLAGWDLDVPQHRSLRRCRHPFAAGVQLHYRRIVSRRCTDSQRRFCSTRRCHAAGERRGHWEEFSSLPYRLRLPQHPLQLTPHQQSAPRRPARLCSMAVPSSPPPPSRPSDPPHEVRGMGGERAPPQLPAPPTRLGNPAGNRSATRYGRTPQLERGAFELSRSLQTSTLRGAVTEEATPTAKADEIWPAARVKPGIASTSVGIAWMRATRV